MVKTWDVVIVGGGVIGLSVAWEVRKRGASVVVVERGELGGEASSAAGGMLAWCDPHLPEAARGLALLSAECYGELIGEIEAASGLGVDLRRFGTIAVGEGGAGTFVSECRELDAEELAELEPGLRTKSREAQWWPEWSVDPRRLMKSLIGACRARGVEMVTGVEVSEIATSGGRAVGVKSSQGELLGRAVVNCAGAWAGTIRCEEFRAPTRPVKGQMLALEASGLRHVVRSPEVYLVPRSDGLVVVGATVEEAGFDKVVHPDAIEKLRQLAIELVAELAEAPVRESWAGLRPGSEDGAPIVGETSLPGYFVACAHFRDGILLAPATGRVVAGLVKGEVFPQFGGLSPFRFSTTENTEVHGEFLKTGSS